MIIYTDKENHITTSGTAHETPDNHPLALMSETKRNCYVYDNGSFYPFVPTNIIEKLEQQEKQNTDIQLALAEIAEMIGG
ncbi:MAG: hypothetical protein ACI4KH_02490 [Oscillospiraceae bacterium]